MTTLGCEWTFYGFRPSEPDSQDSYESQIKPLATFSTAEEFWNIYSHLQRPEALPPQGAFHLFRGTSRAMREDPEHANGGSFLMRVAPSLGAYYWERLLVGLVTGQFDHDVLGVIISARSGFYNLLIWHATATNPDLRVLIARQVCDFLHLPIGIRIDFTAHHAVFRIADDGKKTVHYILEEGGPVETTLQPGRKRHDSKGEGSPAE
jgi:translation initiation factor 4E